MGILDSDGLEPAPAREGLFDAQLMFPTPLGLAPEPVSQIVKRDGHREPFDKTKIANAIFRAAETLGGSDRDRALSLASAVAIFLAKKMRGDPPTADDVDDAVERVLIEMGHGRTALVYARYRDRRARVRRLRAGDASPLLNEVAEAQRESAFASRRASVFVRTSAEKLASWDRARIVDALVQETGLDVARATLIALEVEQQIFAAEVRILTAPLVRELVNAKLIEHGLEEHWRRHVRLGVPLHDARRIICGPHTEPHPLDPEQTGRVLAEAVKREFALSQVFSEEVAEAHLRGDLYVHALGQVDRLYSGWHALEAIARFGVGLPDSRSFSRPPKYADTLLAQMVNFSVALQSHFAGPLGWDAVNYFFAPFVEGFTERMLRQVAQMLVYEYAYRAVVQGEHAPVTELGLWWEAPPELREADAIGPGGESRARSYRSYTHTAQQFAWALLDVLKEGGVGGASFAAPRAVIHIDAGLARAAGCEDFLGHAAGAAAERGNILFRFAREAGAGDAACTWAPRGVVAQLVTLNLPRAAYRAGGIRALDDELDRLVALAAQAHAEKASFLRNLLELGSLGPLGLLAIRREGRAYLEVDSARYGVGLTGLNECVAHLAGAAPHQDGAALELGSRVVRRVAEACRRWADTFGLELAPAYPAEPALARRFAALDLESFPEPAARAVKTDPATHELFYTEGARLDETGAITPMDRVRLEGELHAAVPGAEGAVSRVRMPEGELSARAVADLVWKAFHETRSGGILFAR